MKSQQMKEMSSRAPVERGCIADREPESSISASEAIGLLSGKFYSIGVIRI